MRRVERGLSPSPTLPILSRCREDTLSVTHSKMQELYKLSETSNHPIVSGQFTLKQPELCTLALPSVYLSVDRDQVPIPTSVNNSSETEKEVICCHMTLGSVDPTVRCFR